MSTSDMACHKVRTRLEHLPNDFSDCEYEHLACSKQMILCFQCIQRSLASSDWVLMNGKLDTSLWVAVAMARIS